MLPKFSIKPKAVDPSHKIKQSVSLTAAMIILLAFLVSEPLRLFWSHLLNVKLEFDAQWVATLNNMALLAVGLLLGTANNSRPMAEPPPRSPDTRQRKTDHEESP